MTHRIELRPLIYRRFLLDSPRSQVKSLSPVVSCLLKMRKARLTTRRDRIPRSHIASEFGDKQEDWSQRHDGTWQYVPDILTSSFYYCNIFGLWHLGMDFSKPHVKQPLYQCLTSRNLINALSLWLLRANVIYAFISRVSALAELLLLVSALHEIAIVAPSKKESPVWQCLLFPDLSRHLRANNVTRPFTLAKDSILMVLDEVLLELAWHPSRLLSEWFSPVVGFVFISARSCTDFYISNSSGESKSRDGL